MKIITAFFIVFFISCFALALEDNDLAMTGFYSPRSEIIKKYDNDRADFKKHFLLGLVYKKNKEFKKALLHFANSCFKHAGNNQLKLFPDPVYQYVKGFHIKSDYYDDAVYEMAALFFEYREYEYIGKFIDLISKSNTALFRDAVILKSNAMIESGMYDDAIILLRGLLSQFDDMDSRSLIYIRIASAMERKNDPANAIKEYFNIISLSPESWQSAIACERIRKMASETEYDFNDKENLLLAAALYHSAKISDSLEMLKILIKKELDEHSLYDALKYSVMGYIRTGRLSEADIIISQQKDSSPLYYKLLKIKADELWALKKEQLAFPVYQKLKDDGSGRIQRESFRKVLQYYYDKKNPDYEKILLEFKDKYPEEKSLENLLWILVKDKLKEQDFNTAIKYLEMTLSIFPAGAHSGRTRYWLAKLYTKSGMENDAMQTVMDMAVINPDSAYTWKKLGQLKDFYKTDEIKSKFEEYLESKNLEYALFYHSLLFVMEKDFTERDKRIQAMNLFDPIKKYQKMGGIIKKPELDSRYRDNLKGIEKYFIVGYNEGISREIGLIPAKKEFLPDKYKTLAYLGGKYNNYYFTVTSILELLKYYGLSENITLLPGNIVAKLFPRAFGSQVERICDEKEIQKEMAYAVMKAESLFNHRAVSSAGAEGIMQLMPATAKGIAKEKKTGEYDLRDPLTSISFGIIYLSWLNNIFNGDFESMVAGYNAGARNVKKWQKEINNTDSDYFIEFIPFEETRSYILRTNRFFIQYRIIYNSDSLYSQFRQ